MKRPYKTRLWTDYEELSEYVTELAARTGKSVRVVCVEDGWLIPDINTWENSLPQYDHVSCSEDDHYAELADTAAAQERWRDAGYTFGNGQENDEGSIMDGWRENTRYS